MISHRDGLYFKYPISLSLLRALCLIGAMSFVPPTIFGTRSSPSVRVREGLRIFILKSSQVGITMFDNFNTGRLDCGYLYRKVESK